MKVLVCGSRAIGDVEGDAVYRTLDDLKHERGFTILIHGAALGVDQYAHEWAVQNGVQTVACAANWDYFGKAAGPIRNNCMLELKPDLVIAFAGGRGTEHMVEAAERAGVPVVRV